MSTEQQTNSRDIGISILILTLNEEVNLPDCLSSAAWCDDIVVLDSYSTDNTREIARASGARVYQRHFDNYSAHREWARCEITYRHPWVFSIDADERFTPELVDELYTAVRNATDDTALFLVSRKDIFMGRWIKYSSSYPVWFERLYRPERVHMLPRIVNEHMEANGNICFLSQTLLHYPFNKGAHEWLEKHNRYSSMEAVEYHRELSIGRIDWSGLFGRGPIRRRLALKNLACHFPCRPLIKFLYMYLGKRGLLDGKPGLVYCTLQAIYEYFITLKVSELNRREKRLPF